jgi:hypothetical protein
MGWLPGAWLDGGAAYLAGGALGLTPAEEGVFGPTPAEVGPLGGSV